LSAPQPVEKINIDDLDLSDVWREGPVFNNVIPQLGPAHENDPIPSLLPKYGGRPGVEYMLCPIAQLATVTRDPDVLWSPVDGFQEIWTIQGPGGSIDVQLLAAGIPIEGADQTGNKRRFTVHPDIPKATGLSKHYGLVPVEPELASPPIPEPPPIPAKRGPGRPRKNPLPA